MNLDPKHPPPPPARPPPPPPPTEPSKIDVRPTFIQQWLKQNKDSLNVKSKDQQQSELNELIKKESVFPLHIPASAIPQARPLISFFGSNGISEEIESSGGCASSELRRPIGSSSRIEEKKNSERTTDAASDASFIHRTAVEDVRKIAYLCATYKSKMLANRHEYEYKRQVRINKQHQQQLQLEPGSTLSQKSEPTPPKYHPEYTPLSAEGNKIMMSIHGANYNVCLARAACPEKTKKLVSCWKRLSAKESAALAEAGLGEYVCLEERKEVERCIGSGVQRAVKDILG
mmetsp:Transcript_30966/g.61722  ORF Transcript_30966/g.61722 Transcript_30966/m.61722 type:complete len:288 (-) Transcript_30966:69-932(-)